MKVFLGALFKLINFRRFLLKVGLFGFGRTGKLVADEIIRDHNCTLQWVVRKTKELNHEYASDFLGHPKNKQGYFFSVEEASQPAFFIKNPVDVIIDFSSTQAVYNYAPAADLGIHLVSAVSHYEEKELEFLTGLSAKTAVLYSPNITLGINFLLVASQILQQIVPNADIEIIEEHFRQKNGVSGSALKIAEKLHLDPKTRVNSIRVGGINGRHEVVFGLPNQTIRISHDIISRAAFGSGALFAARSLENKKRGFFTMEELMRNSFFEKIAMQDILV